MQGFLFYYNRFTFTIALEIYKPKPKFFPSLGNFETNNLPRFYAELVRSDPEYFEEIQPRRHSKLRRSNNSVANKKYSNSLRRGNVVNLRRQGSKIKSKNEDGDLINQVHEKLTDQRSKMENGRNETPFLNTQNLKEPFVIWSKSNQMQRAKILKAILEETSNSKKDKTKDASFSNKKESKLKHISDSEYHLKRTDKQFRTKELCRALGLKSNRKDSMEAENRNNLLPVILDVNERTKKRFHDNEKKYIINEKKMECPQRAFTTKSEQGNSFNGIKH